MITPRCNQGARHRETRQQARYSRRTRVRVRVNKVRQAPGPPVRVPTLSPEYPRPQLQRNGWISLDGEWEFAFDREGVLTDPSQVVFDRTIRVPFAPEAPLSGIGDQAFTRAVWYRRFIDPIAVAQGERVMLRFGAVDHRATVWIDGHHRRRS